MISSYLKISEPHIFVPTAYLQTRLGQLLAQAGLVTSEQILAAIREQMLGNNQPIGRILVEKKVIKQATADFFVNKWPVYIDSPYSFKRIGDYLREASLLDEGNIEEILMDQRQLKAKFGEIAIYKGFVKPKTINFFIHHLFSDLENTDLPTIEATDIFIA